MVVMDPTPDELDQCLCGALVAPHWVSDHDDRPLERGSCTSCGLQLVRWRGELWRHIRG